jgi:hypothetical protein
MQEFPSSVVGFQQARDVQRLPGEISTVSENLGNGPKAGATDATNISTVSPAVAELGRFSRGRGYQSLRLATLNKSFSFKFAIDLHRESSEPGVTIGEHSQLSMTRASFNYLDHSLADTLRHQRLILLV